MNKIKEASEILTALGFPPAQRNERSALTLLALANVGPRAKWKDSQQPLLRIWDIMGFMSSLYKKTYAANTRETVRRHTIHQFEQARIVDRNPDDPKRPTNSGKNVYRLTDEVLHVLKAYGTPGFDQAVIEFIEKFGTLQEAYAGVRERHRIPLRTPDGSTVYLSPGDHNKLQVAIIEEFGPRFASGAHVLYIGDTARKNLIYDVDMLSRLKLLITQHEKLPDVVLYQRDKNWLYLIEAVTSHGPVSPKRHRELEKMLQGCSAERVYITAFLTMRDFRKFVSEIAWETEVWIAETPDHMVHFNGPKFLGPYRPYRGGQG
jgi:hypothetical protein